MKAMRFAVLMLMIVFLALAGTTLAQQKSLKIFMSPRSTVPTADMVKNITEKCPNATLTLQSKESDYMLEAGGWSGHYRFTLFKKGGEAVYATQTAMLSNAVKDVCKYMNAQK